MLDSESDESPPSMLKPRRSLRGAFFRSLTERRWWASTFSREQLIDMLKSLVWVGPLTILIWVYAERMQIGTPTFNSVPIHVTGNNLSVESEPPTALLELKGPQNVLDRVHDQVAHGITIDISNTAARGRQRINIIEHIQNLPIFRDSGVSVTKADPAEIDVNVDDFIDTQPIAVQSPSNIRNLEATTHYEPRAVRVHGPKSVLDALARQGNLTVSADLDALGPLKPGHREQNVDLSLPTHDGRITLNPSSVKAFLDVRQEDRPYSIESVPLRVQISADLMRDYYVVADANVANVKVTAPPDVIEQIKSGEISRLAILDVTSADIAHESQDQFRTVEYKFSSPAVQPSAEAKAIPVKFKLVKRETAG